MYANCRNSYAISYCADFLSQYRMSLLDDGREAPWKVSKYKIVAKTMDVIADRDDVFVIATSYSWRFIRKHIPFY